MFFYTVVLLLVATVLEAYGSATTTSKLRAVDYRSYSFADRENDDFPSRMLRMKDITVNNGEDRAINSLDKMTTGLVQHSKAYTESKKIKKLLEKKQKGIDFLKTLNLGDAAAALSSSKLETLSKYIAKYNEKFPDLKQLTLLNTLTTHYGDDAVAKALISAQKDPVSVNKLVRADISNWLNRDLYWVLKSSELDFFGKYLAHFNEKFRDNKISLVGLFTQRYGDDGVTKVLASVKANDDVAGGIAKQLWRDQQSTWLNNRKTVDEVFSLLKFHNDKSWDATAKKINALDDYARLHSGEKTDNSLVPVLSRGFGGDSEWARAIEALANRQDELAGKIGIAKANADGFGEFTANKMRDALFEHWYTQNLDPVKLVAKIFKDENGKTLPRTVIVQYKTFYRRKAQIFPSELKPRRS